MAFCTNIVNLVLVIINTCKNVGSLETLGTLNNLDKDFDNHEV